MKRHISLAAVATAAAAILALVPLAASAEDAKRLVIGVHFTTLTPTPTRAVATGTFSACCAVNDSGSVEASFTVTDVRHDTASIECEHRFQGSLGSFADVCTGTIGPVGSPRQIAEGKWEIVSATGAYAGLAGRGTFTVVGDFTTATGTGSHEGKARVAP